MNELNPDEQLLLDKLVDGELDDTQRRRLLVDLDNQPDGWRRCALAFLEAQSWRGSLSALVATTTKDRLPRPASLERRAIPWGTLLAAAASFLLAFGLGQAWRGHSSPAGPTELAQTSPAEAPRANSGTDTATATRQPEWSSMIVAVDRDNDGRLESVELPVARGPGIDEQWVRNLPPTIPAHILRALERQGHHVQHQRQYYPFDLEGGSQVVVPVDELDVQFVGERQFQ